MRMKRNDPNQLDWFASSPEKDIPAPPRPTFHFNAEPQPQADTSAPAAQPPAPEQEPDTSFNPAEWQQPDTAETMETPQPEDSRQNDDQGDTQPSSHPPDTDEGSDSTPAAAIMQEPPGARNSEPEPAAFDPFESDPFFTTPAQPAPKPEPVATPEEKLLARITAQPEPVADTSALEQEARNARTAREQAETALLAARKQVDNLQARCARMESERDSAVAEANRERQLRAEAVAARNRPTPMPRPPLSPERTASRQTANNAGIPRRTFHAALLGSLVLCVVAYTLGRNHAPASSVTIMEEPAPVAAPITPEPAPTEPPPTAALPDWPNPSGKDFRITANGEARVVVFQYGAFSRGTTLAPAAQRDLARIAESFKPVASSFRIEVEGHTDSSPVRNTHAYSDNHELGMARASAAAEFLTASCGLPAESVTTSSAGDTRPPHAGTDPESQRRNRTVVLKITRR